MQNGLDGIKADGATAAGRQKPQSRPLHNPLETRSQPDALAL